MKNIFLLLLFTSCLTFGQDYALNITPPSGSSMTYYSHFFNSDYPGTIGNPYLTDGYQVGKIYIHGKEVKSFIMRFNSYTNEIEVLDNYGKMGLLPKKEHLKVVIDNDTYVVKKYFDGEKESLAYLKPINKGKVVLYKKPTKVYIRASSSGDYLPRFKEKELYFIAKNDNAKNIKLTKRQLLKYLNDKAFLLDTYIAKNRLNVKNEKDALMVINQYNAL